MSVRNRQNHSVCTTLYGIAMGCCLPCAQAAMPISPSPWWGAGWFYALCALLLLGIFALMYWRQAKQLREERARTAALQESERRFKAIVHNAPVGIGIVDSTGDLIECNQALADMVGYSQDDLLQLNFSDFTHPDDLEREWALIQEMWAQQTSAYSMEKRYIRKDQSVIWVNVLATVVKEAGSVKFGFAFVENITSRREIEHALQLSDKELQLTLEATTDGIWKWNFETDALFFSSRYYTMLGYAPNEFPATFENWRDLIHPDDREHALAVATTYLATKPDLYENEFRLRTKQGDYRWVHSYARVVERNDAGEAIRMIGNHVDITERKQVEAALRRVNERFALATHAAHLGVWDLDIQKDALTWDDRMYELYGVTRGDFSGAYQAWLQGVHPEDAARSHAEVQQAQRGEKAYDTEFRIIRPDGDIRWLRAYAQVVWDENGKPLRMTGINYDITERKRAEERLKASLVEKEVLLRELYHRTKNTLQVIRSMLMLQADQMPDDDQVRKLVADTQQRIMVIALVHQKLYQSQDLSHLNVAEYLEELAYYVLQSFAKPLSPISLVCDIEDVSLSFDTAIPCGLVVNELLSNAMKHAFPDGREGKIMIKLFRNDTGKLELHVADNGVGVPQGFDFCVQETFGLQTMIAIVQHQLQGQINFIHDQGVTCIIEFPDTLYSKRV